MGLLESAGRFIAGAGMGFNLPKFNFYGKTPQGIGAALAGSTQPFPSWRVQADESPPLPQLQTTADKPTKTFSQLKQPQQQRQQQPTDGGGGGGGGGVSDAELDQLSKTDRNPIQEGRYQELLRQFAPPVQESVPSKEEMARQAEEEKRKLYEEQVAPWEKAGLELMRGRRPISELFEEQMATQGVPAKQKILGGLESEQTKLQEQLATMPGEEIARRKETGMLTAAAERRIRALEERPIREQLTKTTAAKEQERVGLERAFQLVDKYIDVLREQEKRELEPIQFGLQRADVRFKSEVDSLAERLTGFNEDRKAKLKEYEMKAEAGLQLYRDEQKEMADLQKLELQHLNTMEQIAARKSGQNTDFDKTPEIEDVKTRIIAGATPQEITTEFGAFLSPDVLNKLFKDYSTTFKLLEPEKETGANPSNPYQSKVR